MFEIMLKYILKLEYFKQRSAHLHQQQQQQCRINNKVQEEEDTKVVSTVMSGPLFARFCIVDYVTQL